MKVYLAICAIVRNEARYIGEWIEFHRLVGVERFYLVDDDSDDETLEVIARHDRGDIELRPWVHDDSGVAKAKVPFKATHQVVTFNTFVHRLRQTVKWCAFIDVDEFLYHRDLDDIREGIECDLEPEPSPSALFVGWHIFGSSGHRTKPPGLTIEAYTRRAKSGYPRDYGHHGKLIANIEHIEEFGRCGSHNAKFLTGHAVDENGVKVVGPSNAKASTERWRINHYYHRSDEEAAERVNATDNNAVAGFFKTRRRMRRHNKNDVLDTDIHRFLPRLKTEIEKCAIPSS